MRRLEGLAKLNGSERFTDDLVIDRCLWGMTVRSHAPRGRIVDVKFGSGVNWSEFVVVDHRDIPGPNEIFLIERDQPVLASSHVRHVHEPVVLLAHESRDAVRQAVREVEVVVEPQPAVLDYRQPPTKEQIQYGDDNVLKHLRIEKGDIEAAFATAAHVVEGVYETGAQEHVYLENQAMAAWVEDGVVVVKGSMQCPYYILNALTHALKRSADQVRVVQAPTGGGFGGKEEYPSNLALHAALLTLKADGRPVKIVYDREEDMAVTTKRHPSRVRHRTGVDASGKLVAQDIDVLLDGGAYATLSAVVLSRGIIHAGGPYSCPNVRIDGRAMLSNSVPFGAFRGFGAPQTQFANERHMDAVARAIGMDPVEFREINLIKSGQTTATGQVIEDNDVRQEVLRLALERSDYKGKQEEHRAFNLTHANRRRGIGLATIFHGSGFTGSGEVYLKSLLRVAGLPDGRVEVLSASTEIGQGTQTIFTQIVAKRLGIEPQQVVIAVPDTSRVPNSGPTVASRTAMVVGRLVERACDDLKHNLGLDASAMGQSVTDAIIDKHKKNPAERPTGEARFEQPPGINWDDGTYKGDAYAAYGWAAYVAQVEVDLRTYDVRVIDFLAVQDIGKVLNETLARGQVQGGVVQAIGWALTEECKWGDGAMVNNQLTNYIIPTANDVPPIHVEFIEHPYPHGGQGAKGVGELPMDGPAPAILSAIADATGADPREIPMTPERLMRLMSDATIA